MTNHLALLGVTLLLLYIMEKAKQGQTVFHGGVGEQLFPLELICQFCSAGDKFPN